MLKMILDDVVALLCKGRS